MTQSDQLSLATLNFDGRYKTNLGIVVAVHKPDFDKLGTYPSPIVTNESIAYEFWGHELMLGPPHKAQELYYWDKQGNCVAMEVPELGITNNSLSEYDLQHAITQSEKGYAIECVDCEECRKWQREHK